MQFERAGAGLNLLFEGRRQRCVALAEKAHIHRKGFGGLQHTADMPGARGAGGGIGAGGRAGAAPHHGGDSRIERFVDLLGADEMDVNVEAAGGDDFAFAGYRLGARADDDIDSVLGVGITGLADRLQSGRRGVPISALTIPQ